jgi:hypothetical protein
MYEKNEKNKNAIYFFTCATSALMNNQSSPTLKTSRVPITRKVRFDVVMTSSPELIEPPTPEPEPVVLPPHEVRQFLREIFAPKLKREKNAPADYEDDTVDALMLEIKNFKNVHRIDPGDLLFQSIQVLLDDARLHKTPDYMDWAGCMKLTFQPFRSVWKYTNLIANEDDQAECVFQIYEYCQNPKRPHLRDGFPYIISTLVGGDILCSEASAMFVDAMLQSDDEAEKVVGEQLQPILSYSCPW